MSDELLRIEAKIDKIDEKISNIDITLAKQQVILEEHQRRSLANEKIAATLSAELKPVFNHVAMVQGSMKLIALLAALSAILGGIRMLLR